MGWRPWHTASQPGIYPDKDIPASLLPCGSCLSAGGQKPLRSQPRPPEHLLGSFGAAPPAQPTHGLAASTRQMPGDFQRSARRKTVGSVLRAGSAFPLRAFCLLEGQDTPPEPQDGCGLPRTLRDSRKESPSRQTPQTDNIRREEVRRWRGLATPLHDFATGIQGEQT